MPASVTKRKYSKQEKKAKTKRVFLPVLQSFPTIHNIQAQNTNFNGVSTCIPIPNEILARANILVLLDFFNCFLLSIQLYQISA